MSDPRDGGGKSRPTFAALLWLAVAPATLTVLGRVADKIQLSEWLAFLVLNWRTFTRDLWYSAFSWLPDFQLPVPNDAQRDLLTFSALLIGASGASILVRKFESATGRLEDRQTEGVMRWYYAASFVALMWVFLLEPLLALSQPSPAAQGSGGNLSEVVMLIMLVLAVILLSLRKRKDRVQIFTEFTMVIYACVLAHALGGEGLFPLERPNLLTSIVVGVPAGLGLVFAKQYSPRSLVRIVLFALAATIVDRAFLLL